MMVQARTGDTSSAATARGRKSHLWRTAGLAWALTNLAGAAVGIFPAMISPAAEPAGPALPALRVLAVVQVAFVLAVYPLILARRYQRDGRAGWALRVGEAVLWLVVAAPFVAACGYLSDATVIDVVRTELVTVAAFPAAWALSALIARGRTGAGAAVLAIVCLVLGHPTALYLAQEFLPGGAPSWLWHAGPVLLAWSSAAVRQESPVPLPLWAWLWPIAAAVAVLALCRRAARHK